jgi:predicted Zn finger-like uncharacterized protein
MAIEFNCPHCSAIIRVPDNAGGGKGKCPRCARRITVPKVSTKSEPRPPAEQLEVFAPPEEPEDPDAVVFAAAEPDIESTGGPADPADLFAPQPSTFGQFPVATPRKPLPADSVSSRLKRKKSGGAWMIPMVFGLLLCGVVGWFVWQQYQAVQLSGELAAETAEKLELPAAEISSSFFRQSPEEVKALMADLEKSPVPISSTLMRVQFGASKKGVTVRLDAGPSTSFYRVVIQDNAALINYRKNQTLQLEESREEDLSRAATSFATDFQSVRDKKADKSVLNDYRNSLALPALNRGLGHQLVAVYGQTPYPCVYEDRDGALYFLMPPGARGFEIVGRKDKDGRVVFPGKYQVKVDGEFKQPSRDKGEPDKSGKQGDAKEEEKSDMKESEDGEMKEGGMKESMDDEKPKPKSKSKTEKR